MDNRFRKTALVIIDMAEADRRRIAWGNGCAEEGIMRLASVMASSAGSGMPTAFVMNREGDSPLRELSDYAPRSLRFHKNGLLSAFSADGFRLYLDLLNPDALIIVGWVSHLCVRSTALDAIRTGYLVHSSDDLLFHMAGTARRPMLEDFELRTNAGLITMHPDASSLLASTKSV